MGRLLRYLLVLVILGFLGLLGYSFFGDLSPDQREITIPVKSNAD
ncbi:MAG: hypothetical protein AAF393_02230 [Pseudomonadota bacterium]